MEPVIDDKQHQSQNVDSCVETGMLLTGSNSQSSNLHSPQHNSKEVLF